MSNYAYIYRCKDYSKIPFDIRSYDIKDTFISPQYDKYILNEKSIDVTNSIHYFELIVFKKLEILVLFTEKYKYIKSLVQENEWERVNILNRSIFFDILSSDFTQNLTKIVMNIDYYNKDEELLEFKGNCLGNISYFEDMIENEYESSVEIKSYSLQPRHYKYLIHISSTNKIEFNMHYSFEEMMDITKNFLHFIFNSKGEF